MRSHIRFVTITVLAVMVLLAFGGAFVPRAVALAPTPTPSKTDSQAKALFGQAMESYQAENYTEAIELFQQMVERYPNSEWADDAQIVIGVSYHYLEEYDRAIEALNGLLTQYPTSEYADLAQYYVGESLHYGEKYTEAIAAYQNVLDNHPSSDLAEDAQFSIGVCYYRLGDCQQTVDEMQRLLSQYPGTEYAGQALNVIEQCKGKTPVATPVPGVDCNALNQDGIGLYRQGHYHEALTELEDALTCYQQAKDRRGEGTTLNNIGRIYSRLGQYQEALETYQQALDILRQIGDRASEGTTLNNIGSIYDSLGQYQEALRYYQQALDILREIGDRAGEGTTLNNIGAIYHSLGQYQEALPYYQQALDILRQIGDRAGEGQSLNNIGGIYHSLGQYQEALQYYQQALDIRREIGDRAGEGTTLNNIGGIYDSLGQYQEALPYYQQALDIRRQIGDRAGEGTTLNNIGAIYHSLGQYQEALQYYQQALDIRHEIGDRAGEGNTLNNIGGIYDSLGQYQEALPYYQQALDILREIRDRAGEGNTLNNIGLVYRRLGQYQEALQYCQQALDISRQIGDRAGEGQSLNNIGGIYDSLGQYQEALKYFQQALDISRQIGDRAGEGTTLNNIGGIYSSLGQYQEALEYSQQALDIFREVGDRAGEAVTLGNIGYLYEQQGQFQQALDSYQQAIDVHEAIRASATIEEFKTALAGQAVDVYEQTTLLLMKRGRPAEAFSIAERARARTFLDQLANAHISPTAGGDPALIQEEEQLRGEIQALDKQLREEWAKPQDQRNDEVIQSLTTQLESKRAEYAQLLQNLKLNNPEYASLVTVAPLTLTDTQKILTNTTLIEYFVTAEQTVAFIVTPDDFHAVQITVTQESLVENLLDFYLFPSLEGVPASMKTLYQQLIAPLKPYIQTDLVGIVPHSVLHYLPFGALYDGEHYLVEEYTLFYAPSASVLPFAFEKRKSSVAPPLVLGDPDGSLPNSREEAKAVAKQYGVPAHLGKDAMERLVWEQGKDAGVLHLSTHGVYNDRSPLFSRVLLAPDDSEDGYLEVYEIYNRGLSLANADLVVLSACQTNVGELSRGDEIVGLSRALIYAGTPSVIASLWSVSDESTRVLMEKFYTHLREGMSKAEALRQAQMEMIASDKYAHPYHWAAFGVTGDDGGSEITEQARQVIERVARPAPVVTITVVPPSPAAKITPGPVATPTAEKPTGGICPALALPLVLVGIVIIRRCL